MNENEIARIVVDTCFRIHTVLGPGLLESVYEKVLLRELSDMHLHVENQVSLPVKWKGEIIAPAFRADILVERKVILELKSVDTIAPVHFKQLLTYLKIADLRLGLLINFGDILMKDGIKRVVNKL